MGESYYQDALSAICGGRSRKGHNLEVIAQLVPEFDNPYDATAVAVHVHGQQVGHLPREQAKRLHPKLVVASSRLGAPVGCRARIVGGWDRGRRKRGDFGIKLFFDEKKIRPR